MKFGNRFISMKQPSGGQNKMKTSAVNPKGIFTLIELLVVISIIAILAGILLPVLNRARQKAQQISCVSDMKQISTAYFLYIDTWRDQIPTGQGMWVSPQWYDLVLPFTGGNKKIFVDCRRRTQPIPGRTTVNDYFTFSRLGIAAAQQIFLQGYYANLSDRKHRSIVQPSRKVLFGDSISGKPDGDSVSYQGAMCGAYYMNDGQPWTCSFHHLNLANLICADGHATTGRKIFRPYSPGFLLAYWKNFTMTEIPDQDFQ
ncbi:MAG: putative major pilin subunit [Lentisphaerae bacterium ADurb.Bin242]|nr:MAG: putative major pilin subunit [Lentisphaerae bacterium ADurb.Bin242]